MDSWIQGRDAGLGRLSYGLVAMHILQITAEIPSCRAVVAGYGMALLRETMESRRKYEKRTSQSPWVAA